MGAIVGIHHLCVQTADLEASLHFYRDLIGFQVLDRETCDFGEYAMLKLGTSRLELIEPNAPQADSFGPGGSLAHFGLQVQRIDEVYADLLGRGVRFAPGGVQTYAQPMGGFRAVSLVGPSGENINLYEFPRDH